jgi:hypothetical protein
MKMSRHHKVVLFLFCSSLLVTIFEASPALGGVEVRYLYDLSNFTGMIPYSGAKIVRDNMRNETYVLYQDTVRVFNEAGMEVYSFRDADVDLGQMRDLAVLPDGDMLTLASNVGGKAGYQVTRRDYRGDPVSEITLKGLPPDFSKFSPSRMVYQDGLLYFADTSDLKIVVTGLDGQCRHSYDVRPLLDLKPKDQDKGSVEFRGFTVDRRGNMVFTIDVLFHAYVLNPDGVTLKTFGQAGSLPGKFNIAAGIAVDIRGDYFVSDILKGAVQIFDKNYNFLAIFGDWEGRAGTLRVPNDIAVSTDDLVYVSQGAGRGVSVYRVAFN